MPVVESTEHLLLWRQETHPFGTNAYVLISRKTRESLLIDAPGDPQGLLKLLEDTTPQAILITHSHGDHTDALQETKNALSIPVAAHPADAPSLPVEAEMLLSDGNIVSFGSVTLEVLHTPGHTPGSLCFLAETILFSGDTLFPAGPGRTGRPEDFRQILRSLEEKIFVLPDATRVYPGHGEPTVLEKEKKEFAVFASRSHPPDLCGDVLWLKS
ncbi:MAG: MBL fold metallo-hydrolase [Candidatus Aminicenantales bacterium]